jgi:hypothetical protein
MQPRLLRYCPVAPLALADDDVVLGETGLVVIDTERVPGPVKHVTAVGFLQGLARVQ